jgi:hypothetical protein
MNRQQLKTVVALLLLVTSMAFIYCVTFVPIPKENQRNADTGIIAVIGLMTMVAGSFFRTISNDNDKNNGNT